MMAGPKTSYSHSPVTQIRGSPLSNMMTNGNDNFSQALELFRQAKMGDSEAYGRLYQIYFTPVYRYIWLRVRQRELADDLTQNVFLKVYEALSRVKEQSGTPLAYFFTVARNTVIDHWRKKKDVVLGQEDDVWAALPDSAPDQHEQVVKKEISSSIIESLEELTEDQREIITLKFVNELSNKEISEMLQKSEEAIRQLQCRALKTLRQVYKKYGK